MLSFRRVSWFCTSLVIASSPLAAFADETEPNTPRFENEHPPDPPPRSSGAEGHGPASADTVVRAAEGDWGMFFRFGGLSTLLAGNNTRTVRALTITQIGVSKVLGDDWHLPFFVGIGFRNTSPNVGDSAADWGADFGIGIEKHFRVWNRISPFVGANLGFGFSDPTGPSNLTFGVGLGPVAGVEYYFADRVSLAASYGLTFQLESQTNNHTAFQVNTVAAGALTLTFYF